MNRHLFLDDGSSPAASVGDGACIPRARSRGGAAARSAVGGPARLRLGSVHRDPQTGLWRMSYLARMGSGQALRVPGAERHGDLILYAESDDGRIWRKPDLGLVRL